MVHLETLKVNMCPNVGKWKGELFVKQGVGIRKGSLFSWKWYIKV